MGADEAGAPRGGWAAWAKPLLSEVKGGKALKTGAMGAEEPCAGSGREGRGLEPLGVALRPGRPGSAGARQDGKLTGTEAAAYARPNAPGRPSAPGAGVGGGGGAGPLKAEGVGLAGSVLITTGRLVAAGVDEPGASA